jgi:hypothetical protein
MYRMSLAATRPPVADLTFAGMPASPVQIMVLTPRPKRELAAGRPTSAQD